MNLHPSVSSGKESWLNMRIFFMDKKLTWANQIAVVTGGSGDIGAEVVRALLALGVKVASADILLFPEIKSLSDNPNFFPSIVDVSNSKEVDQWIDTVAEKWGTPTIAVIGATIVRSSTLVETSNEDWDAVISVGLSSSFYVARAVIKKMLLVQAQGKSSLLVHGLQVIHIHILEAIQ